MKHSALVFLSSISLLTLFSCGEKKAVVKEEKKQFCLSDTMQRMVTIDSARLCPIGDNLKLSGEVSFDENKIVKIFPNSSGQVMEVKVSLGDKVSQGQVLAVIRSADVAGNYSDLASTEADLKIAKRQMDNAESLFKNGISSEREFEEAKENYQKAMAANNKVQSMIRINGGGNTQAGGLYLIKAPASGYVIDKKINPGNFIRTDNGENLFTISDLKNVWIWANVFEGDISKVKEGYNADVTTLAYPNQVFKGKVDKVSNVLDPTNKVMRIRVKLDNSNLLLKPEMFTTVTITNTESATAVCIPSTAVIEENAKTFVVAYNNNCDLKVMPIEISKVVGEQTYVRSGLNAGQKLITHNALMLYDEFTDNE